MNVIIAQFRPLSRYSILFLAYLIILLFLSCKKRQSSDPLASLEKIEQNSSEFGSPNALDTLEYQEDEYQTCVVNNMEWTPGEGNSILIEPTSWVFPGNILDTKSILDGRYTEIVGDRKSISLIVDGLMLNKRSAVVPEPGQKSITDTIDSMLRSGKVGNGRADTDVFSDEVHSEEHLKLLVRANYVAGFGSLSAAFDFNNSSVTSRYLMQVTQVFYTINVERPKSGFFEELPDDLKESSSLSPVYLSSIKYGRKIFIAIENFSTERRTEASLEAKFGALRAKGSLDFNLFSEDIFRQGSVKVLAKGGDPKTPYNIFKAVASKEELGSIVEKGAEWSLDNAGYPMAYEVKNTSDGSIVYLSQTGKYRARICTVKSGYDSIINPIALERLCAAHIGGEDRNFGNNPHVQFSIELTPYKNVVNCKIWAHFVEPGDDRTAGQVIKDYKIVELPEDYFIHEITSSKSIVFPDTFLGHKGIIPFNFNDATKSPVQMVSVIGDSDDNHDDDLYPGNCVDDKHCQIRSINFYPIQFQYTRMSKKATSKA